MKATLWPAAILVIMFSTPAIAQAPQGRSTTDGVYNRDQASRGQDVYLGQCRSCHTPEAHASAVFQSTWNGKPLAELYAYIRERMPKSEPGILSDQEYVDVLSYMLRLNRMPAGDAELPADGEILKGIRFVTSKPMPVRKDP